MELWDAYNADGAKLGYDLVRGQEIPEGVYHIVSEVIIRHEDGMYLMMQRDFNKVGFPGMWEIGAAGSALKGETALDAAIREAYEETGIRCSELRQIFYIVHKEHRSIYWGYLGITDCSKDSVTLQEGETIAYKWLTERELKSFFYSDGCIDAQKERLSDFIASLEK